jgi:uncharacterized protein YybS (DUF2232 family)
MGRKKTIEAQMGDLFQPWHLLIVLFFLPVYFVVGIIPYWMIFKKAGFAPALSLLMVIPGVKLIVVYVIAFSDWKLDASRVPPPFG